MTHEDAGRESDEAERVRLRTLARQCLAAWGRPADEIPDRDLDPWIMRILIRGRPPGEG